MRRILITGCSGYIGSHLLNFLNQKAYPLAGFSHRENPGVTNDIRWTVGDIRSPSDLKNAMTGCECVIHLACSNLRTSFSDPRLDFEVNALGTLNVLESARSAGIRKVIYASTCQVYGSTAILPTPENAVTHPESPYAASKLTGEIYCGLYATHYNLDVIILRLFNVYGGNITPTERETVESIFFRQFMTGKCPAIHHSRHSRDFIHMEDVMRAFESALLSDHHYGVLNIGSGIETTIVDLALIIKSILKSDIEPKINESDESPMRQQADIQLATELIGFQPKVSLVQGLEGMLLH